MVAIRGIYQGGDTVKLDASSVPVHGQYEVVVAFLNPVQQPENSIELPNEKHSGRQEAFEHFMQYRGTLPADFDYTRELANYRNERYEHKTFSASSIPAILPEDFLQKMSGR